jgi:hypothetical protein
MIIGLDSATPPKVSQAVAAKQAGIGLWNGYLSEIPQRDGLYRPWSEAEFNTAKLVNPHPIAFTSGWDDPAAAKEDAARQGLRLCLDVERMIRDDGPWVQGWLDAAAPVGLYGVRSVHVGRRAAFHIAAWYPGADPRSSYPVLWSQPGGLCGWQWQNTHTEFGVPVDRGWYDDGFVQGGEMSAGFTDTPWFQTTFEQLAAELLKSAQGDGVRLKFSTIGQAVIDLTAIVKTMQQDLEALKKAQATPPSWPPGSTVNLKVTVE